MSYPSLLVVVLLVVALGLFAWRARPKDRLHRLFALQTLAFAAWAVGICGLYNGPDFGFWGSITFAGASLIPSAFLAFVHYYPPESHWPSRALTRAVLAIGGLFAILSLSTQLVVVEFGWNGDELWRKPGPMYVPFAATFLMTWLLGFVVIVKKWRRARGVERTQLQYLILGTVVTTLGGVTTNLLLPFLTERSTYAYLGPHFTLVWLAVVAHAIIRHRLMDLRLVIHRGLTLAIAILISLAPILAVLALFWPRLSEHLTRDELLGLLAVIVIVSAVIAPIRNIAERLLDTYVYRTRTNYRRMMREASRALTRVLDLKTVLKFVAQPIADSMRTEGTAVYLQGERRFAFAIGEAHYEKTVFLLPTLVPEDVESALRALKEPLVTDELARAVVTDPQRRLHQALVELNWALVLPLLSEDVPLGVVVVGPKLSGDPFYPHDLDLLMTLANQAGIAIKNAQLYTQVVVANEYVRNIVATIESGVVAVDASGRVTMVNPTAERLTGLSEERLLAMSAAELPEALARLLAGTLGDGTARTEPEITLPAPTPGCPVICTTSPLHDVTGSVVGAVAVFSDLTPLKQLEDERRRAERLAYFEMFAASIAHEIKNPLVGIKTFAQLVPRRHGETRFLEDFSRIVAREIGRIERLVERLRTFSRASERPHQPMDLRLPIGEAAESQQAAFDDKRVRLVLQLGAEVRPILGDHGELEQLAINLLLNAHESTPPEGVVTVALTADAGAITLSVSDTGPGIPAELLERIFDPFFTTRRRGSGLGLTICSAIAASHRAKLRAANRAGGGAIFTVEFPAPAPVTAVARA